jgi:hypothetical protein
MQKITRNTRILGQTYRDHPPVINTQQCIE